MTAIPKKVRDAVCARDPACIVAGVEGAARFGVCGGGRTLQHTVGKGMGGSKLFDTPNLLVTMCLTHNLLLTADAKFLAFGRNRGWVKDRNSQHDPRLTPVLYADGWYRLVGDDRVPVHTPDALEYMSLIGCVTF